ncbi:hypothetical protein PTTG_12154 [Puccinia triticina 1-1 BBBD Race 1]|uniref:Uncharacterized protein n=2 Tax=Puccinia triticina TaxID=208348 RepID=A0A180GMW0_PUCT1|nr:uncharacterized protein PtA15_1A983 [Puccinia triticina]OAV94136.1 hypothetical protein PTTG_12154 [Puccinia triticina 1-1 BBBD Race 1]WAQ81641.1 hypothetical protein PtA15_1A983 [Puccinia triticina]
MYTPLMEDVPEKTSHSSAVLDALPSRPSSQRFIQHSEDHDVVRGKDPNLNLTGDKKKQSENKFDLGKSAIGFASAESPALQEGTSQNELLQLISSFHSYEI